MAWYPGATKMELQPESDAQPAIRPTQMIVHSIVAPWSPRRTYEYWRDSTNLESHFGLGYDGVLAQYIGTETRADANAQANRRPDGTGAVSVETASNTGATDPWTPQQVEELIRLGVWLHTHHRVPLRICRSHSDPGFGYHALYPEWSTGGTACPGAARIRQFRNTVFPGIVARATGKITTPPQEETMPTKAELHAGAWETDGRMRVPWGTATNPTWKPESVLIHIGEVVRENRGRIKSMQTELAALHATVRTLAEALASPHPEVDVDALISTIEDRIEQTVVRLDVVTPEGESP